MDARAEAMSGANISAVSGAAGVYYNPATIAMQQGIEAVFNYTPWFAGISHQFMAISMPVLGRSAVALSITGLQTDEMNVRTPLQPDGTGETFYAGSFRVGMSFSRALTNRVYFGITANYINVSLFRDFTEQAYSGDVAVLYDSGLRNFRFGFMMANIGSAMKFVNETYPMPTSFSFGASANALEMGANKLMVAMATKKPNDGVPQGTFGLEYSNNETLFVRAGYDLTDRVKTFSMGAGVKMSLGNNVVRVDYSYTDFSVLGGIQRFTFGFYL